MGTVATTGPTDSTAYTHTATIGDLCGTSFTAQTNHPLGACGSADQPLTYAGGKVASWKLSCDPEGELRFEAELVFQTGTDQTVLAAVNYAADCSQLTFVASTFKINGVTIPVGGWSISHDNKLDVDRQHVDGTEYRREPITNEDLETTVEFTCDLDNLDHYNRVIAQLPDDMTCAVEAAAVGLIDIPGSSTKPSLTITLPEVRIDSASATPDGPGIIEQSVTGMVQAPAAGEPVSIVYVTGDATP